MGTLLSHRSARGIWGQSSRHGEAAAGEPPAQRTTSHEKAHIILGSNLHMKKPSITADAAESSLLCKRGIEETCYFARPRTRAWTQKAHVDFIEIFQYSKLHSKFYLNPGTVEPNVPFGELWPFPAERSEKHLNGQWKFHMLLTTNRKT